MGHKERQRWERKVHLLLKYKNRNTQKIRIITRGKKAKVVHNLQEFVGEWQVFMAALPSPPPKEGGYSFTIHMLM